MVSPVKEASSSSGASPRVAAAESGAQTTLAELRASVSAIAKEVAGIAEKRTRATREAAVETAGAGVSELRQAIRAQPVVALAVAIGAGAIVALAFTPRSNRKPARSRWDAWMPSMPVTRADLYDMADNIQRSVSRAANSMPAVTPTFERLVDAITRADPSASVSSIADKASSWLQKLRSRAGAKAK